MRNIEWIVLDDMKMNLIAALIVLIFGANFNPSIDLPFKLVDVKKGQTDHGVAKVKSTKILIFIKNNNLTISMAGNEFPLEKAHSRLQTINPDLPVILLVEKKSGLQYSQLVKLLAILKAKGVKNVSLMAQEA